MEALIWRYLSEHWPILTVQGAAFLILLKGYLKLRGFISEFYELKDQVTRIFQFCLCRHREQAVELLLGKKGKNE